MMTKIKLHKAIPMNLSLHGSENWSGNEADLKKIDMLRHKPIRRILGIRMIVAKEVEIIDE